MSSFFTAFNFALYTYTIRPLVELFQQIMGKNWRGFESIFFLAFSFMMNVMMMMVGYTIGYVIGENKLFYWALVPTVLIALTSALFDFKIEVDTPEQT